MSPLWLALLMAPAVVDTLIRAGLALASRRRTKPRQAEAPVSLRTLVLVPARAEGRDVEPTLRSLQAAREAGTEVIVVLDGVDAEAEAVCRELGVEWVVKEPPGPSKGAALAWACRELAGRIAAVDAVMLLDVGSTVTRRFFAALQWPPGTSGLQAWLRGTGAGVGQAIALSERAAQDWEDRGREALGWSVRLRGTGTILAPAALFWVAPRLATRIEDQEASLLLAAAGHRLAMAPPAAVVLDEKPPGVVDGGRQRARWLLGRPGVMLRHPDALLRWLARCPAEGLAFAVEMVSRPLSLTAALRLMASAALLILSWGADSWRLAAGLAAIGLASVAGDAVLLRLAGRLELGSAVRLVLAWLVAVMLLPVTLARWARVRRR